METYRYPQFPCHLSTVHLALFTSVVNAGELRSRIIKAANLQGLEGDVEREALNFAFIDARLLTSALHVNTAIYQAVLAESQGSLRTKTVHSEILWTLNPSNNITEAIRRYGVSDTCTAVVVVRVAAPDFQNVQSKMQAAVFGQITPLIGLEPLTDWSSVRKYYKLNNEAAIKGAGGDSRKERDIIDSIVVSSVAMKSVMA